VSALRVRRFVVPSWLVVAILVSLLSSVLGYTVVGALNVRSEMKKPVGSLNQIAQPGTQTRAQSEPIYTNVTVTPDKVVVSVGDSFSVDVWINNVTDMAGWEIKLFWNKNIVKCLGAHVNTPPEWGGVPFDWFNKTASDVDPNAVYTAWLFGSGIDNDYNATHGQYFKAECFGPHGGSYHDTFNGSLAIVTLAFQALQKGSTSLGLWEDEPTSTGFQECEGIKIGNRNAMTIPSVVFQGFVEVGAPNDQSIVQSTGK
jgi:hypothetical protein